MCILVAAIGVVSAFLPWITLPIIGSKSGVDGTDGWIAVGMFGVAAIIALAGPSVMGSGRRTWFGILGILGLGLGLWKISDVYSIQSQMAAEGGFGSRMAEAISVGIGLWLLAAAGAGMIVSAWLIRSPATVPAANAPVPACTTCGAPTAWVPQHQRHHCARCNLYV